MSARGSARGRIAPPAPDADVDEVALRGALAAHCAALADCRLCGHPPEVLPIISRAAAPRVMLVGQAPGKTETGGRVPFAGRAGKTLFRWLAEAGLSEEEARERIYIAAITRCYPGPSPSGRGDRVPSREERDACSRWLEAELRILRPRVLIPVGRLAIDRFLGPLPLDDVVGRSHRVRHVGGESIVIPLPHPSGASSWWQVAEHRALVSRSLDLLREAFSAPGSRRSAADDATAGRGSGAAGEQGRSVA